jgi:hypothetical protein
MNQSPDPTDIAHREPRKILFIKNSCVKKLVALGLIATLLYLTCGCSTNLFGQSKIGDYVQFGWYAGEPILWRVIGDSANPNANVDDVIIGDPLLFSDKIICKKPFDSAGPHGDDSDRLKNGSNLWQMSNIRAWLNSSAEAGAVGWPCGNPPTEDSVDSNPYADEKGFLADGNFTEYERNLIKPVTQKALLYIVDRELAEGGSTEYKYNDEIEDIVNNYDEAWYIYVIDKVFLLDPKQVHEVYNLFGTYYYNHREDYWLRAPDTHIYTDSSSANVLYIRGRDGVVMYYGANNGSIGVRPALTLNRELVIFESGDGSDVNPYVIAEGVTRKWMPIIGGTAVIVVIVFTVVYIMLRRRKASKFS